MAHFKSENPPEGDCLPEFEFKVWIIFFSLINSQVSHFFPDDFRNNITNLKSKTPPKLYSLRYKSVLQQLTIINDDKFLHEVKLCCNHF
jgi:hypothetical protein